MWPFKPKQKPQKVDLYTTLNKELQERVFERYPIGLEFDYMGVTCKVCEHIRFNGARGQGGILLPPIYPKIKCDYVDKVGVIQAVVFSCEVLDADGI